MGDQDALFIVAGFIVLMIGIASFSVQMTMRQNAKRREQLESDRASRSDQPSVAEKSRRAEALEEAIKREPSLANASSPGELARLDELVLSIQKEWQLKSELEAVQAAQRAKAAEEERSRALQQAAEEKRAADQERARLRKVEEERRKQEREQKIAAMSPVSRWVRTHVWISVGVAAIAILAIVGGIGTVIVNEQRRAEAAQAEADRIEAEVQAAAEKQAMLASCDAELAGQDSTDPEYLAAWATCDLNKTREAVARNVATPEETLTELVQDPEPSVRIALAVNRATPPWTFTELAQDPDPLVRLNLARRLDLNEEAALILLKDSDPSIRLNMIGRADSATPESVWQALATDANSNDEVRLALWKNESLPDVIASDLLPPCVQGLGNEDQIRNLAGTAWRATGTRGSFYEGNVYEYELRPDCYVNSYSNSSTTPYSRGSSTNSVWSQKGNLVTMSINNGFVTRKFELRKGRLLLLSSIRSFDSHGRLVEIPRIKTG